MNVLGISGSLRRDSHNTTLLRAAGEMFRAGGADFEIHTGLKLVPPYDEDDDRDPAPVAVAQLRAAVAGADALFFSTPEYNSSIPGQLKNAIDWLSRPFGDGALKGKPLAVIGGSFGQYGGVWAHDDTRKSFGIAGARVVESIKLSVPFKTLEGKAPAEHADLSANVRDVVGKLAAEVG